MTFTATVTPTGTSVGTPTGTVTFYDGTTSLGTGTLNSSGVASYTTTAFQLSVGSNQSITADYSGDTNYNISTSSVLSQSVNTDGTTTSVNSSANPSVSGQAVTFTATVTANAPGSGTPTGTVTFYNNGTSIGNGSLSVVAGQDQATFTTSALSTANHSITAKYINGDANFTASPTSSAITQAVDANTSTTVASGLSSSVSGQAVTFTATVTVIAPGSGTPTGTVTFFNNGASIGTKSLSVVGGHDQASLTTSTLSTGSDSITAAYNGSGNFNASPVSSAITQVVNMASTSVTVASSVNPSALGQSVTFTATVSVVSPGSTAAAYPTGTVTFYDGGSAIGTESLSVVGGKDQASLTTSALSIASHSITADYTTGDGNFNPSPTSAAITQFVNPGTTLYVDSSFSGTSIGSQSAPWTTIQASINVASAGYTILVEDGSGYSEADTVNVQNLTIEADTGQTPVDTSSTAGSGIGFNISASGVTISGLTIEDFSTGVNVRSGSTAKLTNCNISGNSGNNGGGLANYGTLTLTNCTVSGNSAVQGGGLYNYYGASLTADACTFSLNRAQFGGALKDRGHIDLIDSGFTGNTAATTGGGVLCSGGATGSISGCTISGNHVGAQGAGGGIYVTSGQLTIVNSSIDDNSSASQGGGLENHGGNLTLTNCTVSGNSAVQGGGGLATNVYGGTTTLTNCTVSGNSAGTSGGGAAQLRRQAHAHQLHRQRQLRRPKRRRPVTNYRGGRPRSPTAPSAATPPPTAAAFTTVVAR